MARKSPDVINEERKEVLGLLFSENSIGRCPFVTRKGDCELCARIGTTTGDEALERMSYRGDKDVVTWDVLDEHLQTGWGFNDGLDIPACRAILISPIADKLKGRLEATRWAMSGTVDEKTGMPEAGACIGPNIQWREKQ